MKTVLITGFGPFPGVADNPSARLARALDGRVEGGVRFVGEVLPVSYRRAPAQTLRLIDAHKACAVLGTGVDVRAAALRVESQGSCHPVGRVDVEGQTLTPLQGPATVAAPWSAPLAEALGVALSTDAGRYVCNAWLYQVARRAAVPVSFLHLPPAGASPDAIASAVASRLA